jgi:hypothetical protein
MQPLVQQLVTLAKENVGELIPVKEIVSWHKLPAYFSPKAR